MDASQITEEAQANEKRRLTNFSKNQGPPRNSALNQSLLLGSVMQVNRRKQTDTSVYDTEASGDMKSKIDDLFGTTTDEVTSENGDIDQSIQN